MSLILRKKNRNLQCFEEMSDHFHPFCVHMCESSYLSLHQIESKPKAKGRCKHFICAKIHELLIL